MMETPDDALARVEAALAAAYAEGRDHGIQQAAALLDAVSGYFDAVDQECSPAEVYQKETTLRRAWESALHLQRVAGLNRGQNASESPPTYSDPRYNEAVRFNEAHRDASESGQPPEASDE